MQPSNIYAWIYSIGPSYMPLYAPIVALTVQMLNSFEKLDRLVGYCVQTSLTVTWPTLFTPDSPAYTYQSLNIRANILQTAFQKTFFLKNICAIGLKFNWKLIPMIPIDIIYPWFK